VSLDAQSRGQRAWPAASAARQDDLGASAAAARCHAGGAGLSRTTRSAQQSWGECAGESGWGRAAGACVDASRFPSWHSGAVFESGGLATR